MSGQNPKTKLMGLGAFLLPLILVKSSTLLIGQPPQAANAANGATIVNDGVIEVFTPEWSLEQIAATHQVEDLREVPFGESPLLHARKNSGIDPIKPDRSTTITPPDVSVRIILHSRHGDVALIDRRRYRAGDALGEDGWFVEEIDARSVSIVHRESGKKATLVVPMPR